MNWINAHYATPEYGKACLVVARWGSIRSRVIAKYYSSNEWKCFWSMEDTYGKAEIEYWMYLPDIPTEKTDEAST